MSISKRRIVVMTIIYVLIDMCFSQQLENDQSPMNINSSLQILACRCLLLCYKPRFACSGSESCKESLKLIVIDRFNFDLP